MAGLYPPLGQLGPLAIARWGIRTQVAELTVTGLEHVPAHGPVMIVGRHYHHLLDGSIVVTRVRRPVHIVVGLDWAATPLVRRAMEWACRRAEYPIVLRPPTVAGGAYRRDELVRYTRAALRETARLLRDGRVVLVFPEGYPTIDPSGSRKPSNDAWLPFAAGYGRMLAEAEADGRTQVAVVPLGFHYAARGKRWAIAARFGRPLGPGERGVADVTAAVRRLSADHGAPAATPPPCVQS